MPALQMLLARIHWYPLAHYAVGFRPKSCHSRGEVIVSPFLLFERCRTLPRHGADRNNIWQIRKWSLK